MRQRRCARCGQLGQCPAKDTLCDNCFAVVRAALAELRQDG